MRTSLAQSVSVAVAKRILPRPLRLWAKDILNAHRVERNPGRVVLVKQILPAYAEFGGRILWVGCRRYTKSYAALLNRQGGECWTTDIEPTHAKWGERGRHVTADLLRIDEIFPSQSFDIVLCNGVFGFGVDTRESQSAALTAMHTILKPGGRLLLGWNTDRVDDPTQLDFARQAFVPDTLTGHAGSLAVPEAGYVYAFLRRTAE
jgi:SAM-dependent methyltransferase